MESVALARKAAEEQRIRKIGTPSEVASTTAQALQTTGYGSLSELPSGEELERLRKERGITPGRTEADLQDLAGERLTEQEARQQQFERQEKDIRLSTYGAQIDKINAEKAKKATQITALRGY